MSKSILRPVTSVLGLAATLVSPLAGVAIMAGSALFLGPSKPKASPAATARLSATLIADAPRGIVFGRTAMHTDVRYHAFTGTSQEYYEQIVCVASHQVEAIEEIFLEGELAWTSAGGAQGRYAGYLTVTPRLVGTSSNGIAIDSVWTSACTLTGCAYVHLKYKRTGNTKKAESPFAQSIPSRMTIRGKGALVYDPRFDSTAGGSGAQRANDQTTWAYAPGGVESGRIPILQELWYELGWRINGKLAVGRGIPPARIDMPSRITSANLCDESVAKAAGGTEPRYRSDGVFTEADDPLTVSSALCAACSAELTDENGKIAVRIDHNDMATPVVALTEADIIDDDHWVILPDEELPNLVRGRFVDPSNEALYQPLPAPAVKLTSPDGLDRIAPSFDLLTVQSPSQWQRLAKMWLQKKQYPQVFTANFGPRAWAASYGKVVTLSHAALGFNLTFRVVYHKVGTGGVVRMSLRLLNAAIYAWMAEEAPAVQAAAPLPYDPLSDPLTKAIDEGTYTYPPSASAPTSPPPSEGDQWPDTSSGITVMRRYTSGVWSRVSNDVTQGTHIGVENGADVTSLITGSATVTVQADSTGAILGGELPRNDFYDLIRQGLSVTTSATWTRTVLTGTVTCTVGGATGVLSTTALGSAEAIVRLTAVYGATTRTFDVKFQKQSAAPSSSSGSGGTGSNASDTSFGTTTSTSHAAISDELTITLGAAVTQARLICNLYPRAAAAAGAGTFESFGKGQWWDGSAWQDVNTEVASDPDAWSFIDGETGALDRVSGTLTFNVTKTGLTAGSTHKFRFMARNASGTHTMNYQGSVEAKGDGS